MGKVEVLRLCMNILLFMSSALKGSRGILVKVVSKRLMSGCPSGCTI